MSEFKILGTKIMSNEESYCEVRKSLKNAGQVLGKLYGCKQVEDKDVVSVF
jgi:hypothetical protein